MNLLVVSPWFPCPPDNGSRLRAYHLIREWAKAGHSIRLITGLQEDIAERTDRETLERLCKSVSVFPWRWHDGDQKSRLRDLMSSTPRSIIETDNPAMRQAVIAELARKPDVCIAMELASAPLIPADTNGVPVVLEQAEVSGVARAVTGASSTKARWQAALTRAKHDRYWRRELKRFDAVTAVSEEEAAAVRTLIGGKTPSVFVVPNGVDLDHYSPEDAAPITGRILYNGSLTYGPNREAVSWFAEEILPRIVSRVPEAHLVVTGHAPGDVRAQFAGNDRVFLTGFVPDIRPVLASATVCAVPLKMGGGTRLKILEAWAAGVPVVSTRIGAAGLAGSEDGSHLLLADSAEAFAGACVRILTQPELGQRIAMSGRRLVEERYNWTGIAEHVIEILADLPRSAPKYR